MIHNIYTKTQIHTNYIKTLKYQINEEHEVTTQELDTHSLEIVVYFNDMAIVLFFLWLAKDVYFRAG